MLRHMGRRIMVVSSVRTSPAPREIQTEKVRALRGVRRASVAWAHLEGVSLEQWF